MTRTMVPKDGPEGQLREIYTRFAISAQYAQNLEGYVIAVLKLAERLKRPEITTSDLTNLDDLLSRRTLGQLLAELRSIVSLDAVLEANLSEALKKRNYLIHHYFGENAHRFMTEEGRRYCLFELRSLAGDLLATVNALKPLIDGFFRRVGWSSEDVRRGMSLIEQAMVPEGPDFGE